MNRAKELFVILLLFNTTSHAMNADLPVNQAEQADADVNAMKNKKKKLFSPKFIKSVASAATRIQEYGHNKSVNSVAFDPSGKLLGTGSNDGKARIFNIASKECVAEFDHGSWVRSVAFDPSGELLATASGAKARIFNVETGDCAAEFDHDSYVRSIAFDPSGKLLATGGNYNKVRIFNHANEECVAEFYNGGGVNAVAFDPSGGHIATACGDKARIFDTANGECVHEFDHNICLGPPSVHVQSIVFDSTGKLLATGSYNGEARIFNVASEECVAAIAHGNLVLSVVFDASETHIATGCADGKMRIFNIANNECVAEFDHDEGVSSVAFDLSGNRLATGCSDGKARIFNLKDWASAREFLTLPENMDQLYLLQACDLAMQEKKYVHVSDDQWATFQTLPKQMQKALRKYIVTGEQYNRIKNKPR